MAPSGGQRKCKVLQPEAAAHYTRNIYINITLTFVIISNWTAVILVKRE